jgi:RimJ/RimL family protein N-acetyltransferase
MPDPPPIPYPEPPLSDGVVSLRRWHGQDDVAWVHEGVLDPDVPRFTSIPPDHTVEGVAAWLAGREADFVMGRQAAFAVVDAVTGDPLGSIGVVRADIHDPGCAEVGYWVVRAARGRGVATRAVRLIVPWAFETMAIGRMQLTVNEDNLPSRRVAAKSGFREEGLLRALREHQGGRVDLLMYARLPDDPDPAI